TPATPTEPTTPTAPTTPTSPTVPTASAAEVPKYGGVYTFADVSEGTSFDGAYRGRFGITNFGQTNGALITGDWSKGPAGGGGNIFENWNPVMLFQTGEIAESWEIVGDDTVIFHNP
ncbi:MAG: hypothetical protein HYU83_04775, partial [Chloroflexi bacterium]|nr:hypothetical protein [Chloroflexota bacterium]